MDETPPTAYETPTVIRIGSIADITQGSTPGLNTDGRSGRGKPVGLPTS